MSKRDLENEKQELLKQVKILTTLKNKLYSNVDIETPMGGKEKELNKEIAEAYSKINEIIKEKRKN